MEAPRARPRGSPRVRAEQHRAATVSWQSILGTILTMHNIKRSCAIVFLLILGTLVPAATARAEDRPLFDQLPAGAVVAFAFNGSVPGLSETALAEIWKTTTLPEFVAPMKQMFMSQMQQEMAQKQQPGEDGPDNEAVWDLFKLLPRSKAAIAFYPDKAPAADGNGADRAPGEPNFVAYLEAKAGSPLREAIDKLLADMPKEHSREINGVTMFKHADKDWSVGFTGDVLVAASDSLLELALQTDAPHRFVETDTYRRLSQRLKPEGAVVRTYVDMAVAMGQVPAEELAAVNDTLTFFGIERMTGIAATWGPSGRGMVSKMYLDTPTDHGLLAALRESAVDEQLLGMVNSSADYFTAFNVDPLRLYDLFTKVEGKNQAEGYEMTDVLQQFGSILKNNIKRQMVAAFAPGTVITAGTSESLLPNLIIRQRVRDPQIAAEAVNYALFKIAAKINPAKGHPADIMMPETTTYKGHRINYLSITFFTPAYTIIDGWMIMALQPTDLRDEIDLMASAKPIADNKTFGLMRQSLPLQRPQMISYSNVPAYVRRFYFILPYVATAFKEFSPMPLPIDIGKMPGSEELARLLLPSISGYEISEHGVTISSYGTDGLSNLPRLDLFFMIPFAVGATAGAAEAANQPEQAAPVPPLF